MTVTNLGQGQFIAILWPRKQAVYKNLKLHVNDCSSTQMQYAFDVSVISGKPKSQNFSAVKTFPKCKTPGFEFYLSNILNQSYNATRKWLDFGMNMWCRTVYDLRYIAQLLTKNLWCTVSNVSTARLSELLSDWSKRLFLVPGACQEAKIKTFSSYPTRTLSQ